MQCIEPPSGLIYALCYKVSWISLLEFFLIRKRIIPLCIWHRAAIEPYIYDIRFSLELYSIRYQCHTVYIWFMQISLTSIKGLNEFFILRLLFCTQKIRSKCKSYMIQ